jgi:hypothetical protein
VMDDVGERQTPPRWVLSIGTLVPTSLKVDLVGQKVSGVARGPHSDWPPLLRITKHAADSVRRFAHTSTHAPCPTSTTPAPSSPRTSTAKRSVPSTSSSRLGLSSSPVRLSSSSQATETHTCPSHRRPGSWRDGQRRQSHFAQLQTARIRRQPPRDALR